MSGYGGGVENLNVGIGQVAVSYLGGAKEDLVTENGTYAKSNLDMRLYNVKALGGEMGVWYDYSFSKGGAVSNGEHGSFGREDGRSASDTCGRSGSGDITAFLCNTA